MATNQPTQGGSTQLPYWDDLDSNCWDKLALNDKVLPGTWHVDGDCERDIDKKKAKGSDGRHVEDNGYLGADITLHGELVTRADWRTIQEVLRELHPRKKGGPKFPLNATHPALAVMGITKIYLKGVKPPTVDDKGRLQLKITAMEYIPPTPTKKTAGGELHRPEYYANAGGKWTTQEWTKNFGQPVEPLTAADREAKLNDEMERLTNPNYKPSQAIVSRTPLTTNNGTVGGYTRGKTSWWQF